MDIVTLDYAAFDQEEIASRLLAGAKGPSRDRVRELVEMAAGLLRPRALYRIAAVRAERLESLSVAGVVLESRLLLQHLRQVGKAFPFIITVGPEIERLSTSQGDLLDQYYLEEIADIVLGQVANWLASHLEERFSLGPLSSLSPGSLEDWPITEQSKLFSIFGDPEPLIGVRLTESLLMVPRKSISGILFPSEEGFLACQHCARERCPRRMAQCLARDR